MTCLGAALDDAQARAPDLVGIRRDGISVGGGAAAYAYAFAALVAHPQSLPAGRAAAWVDSWCWLPGLVLPMGLLLLVVPDGRLLSPRWRPAVAALIAGSVVGSVGLSGSPTFDLGSDQPIDNPLAFDPTAWHVAATLGYALVARGGSRVACVVRSALPTLGRGGAPAASLDRRRSRPGGLPRHGRGVHLGRVPLRIRPPCDRPVGASGRHRGRDPQVPAVRARSRRQPRPRLRGDDGRRGRRLRARRRSDRRTAVPRGEPRALTGTDRRRRRRLPAASGNACSAS